MYNIVCDENIGKSFVEFLRKNGYKVLWITESFPGIPDEEVMNLSKQYSAILITSDKDFARMIFAFGISEINFSGVILLRLFSFSPSIGRSLLQVLSELILTSSPSFVTITEKSIRIRKI